MLRKTTLSFESIAFQGTKFFDALVQQINQIRSVYTMSSDNNLYDSKEVKELSNLIKTYTNINANIRKIFFGANANIPSLNRNSILLSDFRKVLIGENDVDRLLAGKATASIWVDLAKGRVLGDVDKLVFQIGIAKNVLLNDKEFTSEETTAMILHEVGHIFTFIEFTNRLLSTNQCLSLINKASHPDFKYSKKEMVFKRLQDDLDLSREEINALDQSKSDTERTVIIAGASVRKSLSELGNINIYDSVSSEQLADQFATRMGAGNHVVSASFKLSKGENIVKYISDAIILIGLATILFSSLYGIFVLITLLSICTPNNYAIYDNTVTRFNRIKQANVEIIKSKETSSKDKEALIEQNEMIDGYLKQVKDHRRLFEVVAYWVRPGYRKEKDFIDLQKSLEKIASNDLFTKAEKLNQL